MTNNPTFEPEVEPTCDVWGNEIEEPIFGPPEKPAPPDADNDDDDSFEDDEDNDDDDDDFDDDDDDIVSYLSPTYELVSTACEGCCRTTKSFKVCSECEFPMWACSEACALVAKLEHTCKIYTLSHYLRGLKETK